MNLDFTTAIADLGPGAAMRIANAARPPAEYLLASILPEMPKESYQVDSASMTVRATMAGLSGMDSPYPAGGAVEMARFLEQTAKLSIDVALPEQAIRQLQQMLLRLQYAGGNTLETVQSEALNFYDKVVLQAMIDRDEWLRGQALSSGALAWTFGQKALAVSYGIPAANVLTPRTTGGSDAYHQAGSGWWDDYRSAWSLLGGISAIVTSKNTAEIIVNNSAHNIQVADYSENAGTSVYTVRRLTSRDGVLTLADARDAFQIFAYNMEGEIRDPSNPGQTTKVQFYPDEKVTFVGRPNRSVYRVGEGSTMGPDADARVGYTHMAPTVEGGGTPGRWGRLYTPEDRPWELRGQAVENSLPVIEFAEKIVIAESELS